MTRIKDIVSYLESLAPGELQESYDNAGLLTGSPEARVNGVLLSLDCTEEVVAEAREQGDNLIICHHPVIFRGLKSLTGKNYVERTIIQAIKHDIAIYAIHTNLDNIIGGVNSQLAKRLGLQNLRVLRPLSNLQKLVCFVPEKDTRKVLDALHSAGAGNIGNYSECSFKVTGKGYFKPNEAAHPAIGRQNIREEVVEDRIELIYPKHLFNKVLKVLINAHPYEEVAYYITDLANYNQENGAGMLGELDQAMAPAEFLTHLQQSLNLECIRHTNFTGTIKKVAICGGAGSFLLKDARQQQADAFVTGDVRYHEFFDAEGQLLYCDIGHYESEVGTKELLHDLLTKKFTNFALHLSECVTNPIKYYK